MLNIAEATGRHTSKDQLRFFHIALGSMREVQAAFDIHDELFSAEQKDLLDHTAASLYKLIKAGS